MFRANLKIIFCCSFFILLSVVNCENGTSTEAMENLDGIIQEGRTFVHGTLKRFMVIAPAIFFKLGVAFTLLILVTLAAVNNGFIGFLILVVGLSSVLARLQGSSSPAIQPVPISYASPLHSLPQLSHHHNPWINRRSDTIVNQKPLKFLSEPFKNYNSNDDLRNTGVYYQDHLTDVKV